MTNSELRFDGRVVVITGAGRGLGREYALLLAARGAQVVVNNRTGAPAHAVADEINASGGIAIACESNVRSPTGARAPVELAIERFGRVDVVVNNAGTVTLGPFGQFDDEAYIGTVETNLHGAWYTTQAAWPTMLAQGYGRVIMIGSRVMLGMPNNAAYSATRGAMLGLSNALAAEGRPHGVLANTLMVTGFTDGVKQTMHDEALQRWLAHNMPPAAAARPLAWLAHEDCAATGQCFSAFGRGFSRIFIGETRGYISPSLGVHTPEAMRDEFAAVTDYAEFRISEDTASSAAYASERLGAGAIGSIDRAVGVQD